MEFKKVAMELASLLEEKNAAYGDAINRTAEILAILYPNGIPLADYKRVLIRVRMIDKLCRDSTTPDEENIKDWTGYGLRELAEYDQARALPVCPHETLLLSSPPQCKACGKVMR